MNSIPERIQKFIEKNQVLTLATTDGVAPYCCSIFYVFDEVKECFYFMSAPDTKHIREALQQSSVAGTIVSGDTRVVKIQGIQFTGKFSRPPANNLEEAKKSYLRKFPMARLFDSGLWMIEIEYIKMTDNTLGFGKKITWSKEAEPEESIR